jgi:hypothetical protein
MSNSARKIIPLLVSAALLAAVACKKDGGAAAAGNAMGYLPKDASAVLGLNFSAIRESKIYKQFEPQIEKLMSEGEALKKVKDTCKLDIASSAKSVLIALGKDPSDEKQMYMALIGLNKATVNKCVDDLKAKGEKLDRKDDGALTAYTVDDKQMWVWWAADDTVVSSPSAEDSPDALKALAGGGAKLKDKAEVMDMVGKTDTGAMLWMAGALPDMPNMGMIEGQLGGKPQKVWFSANVPEDLSAKAGLIFADDATAEKVKKNLDTQLAAAKQQPMVGAFLGGVKVDHSGKEVRIDVTLSADDVKTLTSMAKMGGAF